MADGFAQASGRTDPRQPAHGARRRQRRRRHLQRPGQQVAAAGHRRPAGAPADHDGGEPDQPRRGPRAPALRQVEPRAAARAGRPARARAGDPPRLAAAARARRSCRSRWTTGTRRPDDRLAANAIARTVGGRAAPDPESARGARASARTTRATRCSWPGPTSTRAAAGTPRSRSSRTSGCRCGRRPRPAAGGSASPRPTRTSSGVLPPAIGPASETLAGHDLVLVVGSSVFPYYPYIPGAAAARGRHARADHVRSRRGRARADGRRDRRRRRARARARCSSCSRPPSASRPRREPLPGPARRGRADERLGGDGRARRRLARGRRSPSSRRRRAPSRCATACGCRSPGSYYFSASGGLGFGIAAAVGVQLAQPERPVVCVLGEGSAQYGITALWTAAAYKRARHVPGAAQRGVHDPQVVRRIRAGRRASPASTSPALDVAAIAHAYGVPAAEVDGREELAEALRDAIAVEDGPRLVQVPVASGMWLD